jgi:dienelactone hydrolase
VCGATAALAGGERAIADLDTVFEHMDTRADVGQKQVLVGGVSRGGALSVAYAGRSPQRVNGVVNFVGGWMGDKCAEVAAIDPPLFSQGAGFSGPTLWLYGDRDPYYSLEHSRLNFAAFEVAGGTGAFHEVSLPCPLFRSARHHQGEGRYITVNGGSPAA